MNLEIAAHTEQVYDALTREWSEEQAKKRNCYVWEVPPDALALDLDSLDALNFARDQIDRAKANNMLPIEAVVQYSSSGGNYHLVVWLSERLSLMERIAYQAMLGSDAVCELLRYKRMLLGEQNPILLFRPNGSRRPDEHR